MRRFEVERAIDAADLPGPAVGVMSALCRRMDARQGVIPRRWQPSLGELARMTGYSRRTVMRHLRQLETGGWVKRDSPALLDAARFHLTTAYELLIPESYPQARVTPPRGLGTQEPWARDTETPGLGSQSPEARVTLAHKTRETSRSQEPSSAGDDDSELVDIARRELAALTGRAVTEADAGEAARLVLDGRTVKHRGAYLRRALRADPGRYLPAPSGPPPFRQLRDEGKA